MIEAVRDGASEARATLLDWRREREEACGLVFRDIAWSSGREWRYDGERLEHESGLFFSIVGRRFRSSVVELDGLEQPMIDQPEVGVLGFLLRHGGGGHEVLLQAKTEPGNVNRVQIAPTVQATVSNYTRVHGGAPTPYLEDFFSAPSEATLADSLQSEQGTRFLSKYNRNLIVLTENEGPAPVSAVWRWFPLAHLLAALHEPFAINTDARSTLVASDWTALAGSAPFSRWRGAGGFGELLLDSFEAPPVARPLADLRRWRDEIELAAEPVRLDRLSGWCHDGVTLVDRDRRFFAVPMVRVEAPDREVTAWDQPLVRGLEPTTVTLVCQKRDDVLRFRLHGSVEPGFREKVQLTPTLSGEAPAGTVIASCRQSDEGGRFDRVLVDYRVLLVEGGVAGKKAAGEDASERTTWLSLSEVHCLLSQAGACTNELRTALSLLLAWL